MFKLFIIFAGNLKYLLSLEERSEEREISAPPEGSAPEGGTPVQPTTQGMVLYKGALLDIESFMQRLEKAEKTYTATEHRLKELQEEMGQCFCKSQIFLKEKLWYLGNFNKNFELV